MGSFRVVKGQELTDAELERVLDLPFVVGPAPEAVRESERSLIQSIRENPGQHYGYFFMFEDELPVGRLMVRVEYGHGVKGVLGFENAWASNTGANHRFLQVTRESGNERTIFEELFIRGLSWGIQQGCEHPVLPPYHSTAAEKAWKRFVDKGYVLLGESPLQNKFGKVPEPLDLEKIQSQPQMLHNQIQPPKPLQIRQKRTTTQ